MRVWSAREQVSLWPITAPSPYTSVSALTWNNCKAVEIIRRFCFRRHQNVIFLSLLWQKCRNISGEGCKMCPFCEEALGGWIVRDGVSVPWNHPQRDSRHSSSPWLGMVITCIRCHCLQDTLAKNTSTPGICQTVNCNRKINRRARWSNCKELWKHNAQSPLQTADW